MPLPRSIVVYAAGTDTRPQYTTPADPRQVADLVTAHQDRIVGGTVMDGVAVSDSTWKVMPVSGGNLVADDGNWNATYDCWGPPDDWFDDYSTIVIDCVYSVGWPAWAAGNASAVFYIAFRVRNQANPSGATTSQDVYSSVSKADRDSVERADSGVCPLVISQGEFIEMRLYQTSGTLMNGTVLVRWGVRLP